MKNAFTRLGTTPRTIRANQLQPILAELETRLRSAEETRSFREAIQSFYQV